MLLILLLIISGITFSKQISNEKKLQKNVKLTKELLQKANNDLSEYFISKLNEVKSGLPQIIGMSIFMTRSV